MGEWATYALADFVPFGPEVYARLFVRHNAEWIPLPVFGAALGPVAIWLAHAGRSRALGGLLAAVWTWVGWSFYLGPYGELNWAGPYIAGAFFAQAALLLGLGLAGWLTRPPSRRTRVGLAGAGLAWLALPLIDPLLGRPWSGIEVFGHAPEPTAAVTLGLVLAVGRWPLMAAVVPAAGWALGLITAWVLAGG